MAKGADTLGIQYADENKLSKILFPANWKEYPRIAGFLRNNDMLSIATHLIAFWNGESSRYHLMRLSPHRLPLRDNEP